MRVKKLDRFNRFNKAIVTSREAIRAGISPSSLSRLTSTGKITRIARGFYLNNHASRQLPIYIEDLIYSVISVKDGAICLISALSYYNLTNEIPRQNWISIPSKPPSFYIAQRKRIRFVNLPDYNLGLKTIRIKGISVKIYDAEITIVDSFKYLSLETAIYAFENYFRKKQNPDIKKLEEYSKIRNIDISKYIKEISFDKIKKIC